MLIVPLVPNILCKGSDCPDGGIYGIDALIRYKN
jgi:hypothetical protein